MAYGRTTSGRPHAGAGRAVGESLPRRHAHRHVEEAAGVPGGAQGRALGLPAFRGRGLEAASAGCRGRSGLCRAAFRFHRLEAEWQGGRAQSHQAAPACGGVATARQLRCAFVRLRSHRASPGAGCALRGSSCRPDDGAGAGVTGASPSPAKWIAIPAFPLEAADEAFLVMKNQRAAYCLHR